MTTYFTTELIQNPSGDRNFKVITQQHDPSSSTYNGRGSVIGSLGLIGHGNNTTNNTNSSDNREAFMNFHRGPSTRGSFITFTTGNDNERLVINEDGNVGINILNPQYTLDIDGDINCSGKFRFNGNLFSIGDISDNFDIVLYNTDQEITGIKTFTTPPYFGSTSNTFEGITAQFGRANDTNYKFVTYSNNTAAGNEFTSSIGLNYEHPTVFNNNGKKSHINFYRGGGTSGSFMTFTTNDDDERMRLSNNGTLCIGTTTTNDNYKLIVKNGYTNIENGALGDTNQEGDFGIVHSDLRNTILTDYMISQNSDGDTSVNCASGKSISLKVNNSELVKLNDQSNGIFEILTDCSCSQFIGDLSGNADTATKSTSTNLVNVIDVTDYEVSGYSHYLSLVFGTGDRYIKRTTKILADPTAGNIKVLGELNVNNNTICNGDDIVLQKNGTQTIKKTGNGDLNISQQSADGGDIIFSTTTSNTETMRMKNNGVLCVGGTTTDTSYKLYVSGSTNITGTCKATTFDGTCSKITISTNTQSSNYPLLFENGTGSVSKNTSLVYNPGLNKLSLLTSNNNVGTFVGNFEGNLSGSVENANFATTVTGNINITSNNSTNINYPILFASSSGYQVPNNSSKFTLNPGSSAFNLAGINLIGSSNTLTINGTCIASNFVSTSDIKLKENIKPIESSMDKVLKIKGYNYNFKTDSKKDKKAGLIAQEVEKVIPEIVKTTNNNKTIDYNGIIPYLVECIKIQNNKINILEQKLENLINT